MCLKYALWCSNCLTWSFSLLCQIHLDFLKWLSQRVQLYRSKLSEEYKRLGKTLVFPVTEYHPSLVLIKATGFLGIVVFVKCMWKALIGVLVGVLICFQKIAETLFDVTCANALTHQGQGQWGCACTLGVHYSPLLPNIKAWTLWLWMTTIHVCLCFNLPSPNIVCYT